MNHSSSGSLPVQPKYSMASIIGQICFNIIIIIAAFLGNAMVIAAVCASRKLRKATNYFIVSLAVSDILIAASIVPLHVHHYLNYMVWNLGKQGCEVFVFLDFLCSAASTTNVALISIDRFLALSYPFKYQRLVSGMKSAFAIVFVWCYAGILSSLSLIDWSDDAQLSHHPACYKTDKTFYLIVFLLGICLPLVILIVAYSMVFNLAFKQAMLIKRHSTVQCDVTKHRNSKYKKSAQTRMLIRELKATKTLMIVVGTFLLCWLPLFVLILVQQHCPKCINEDLSSLAQQIIGIIFAYTLPRLSSAANPIIYSVFNREFRSVLCTFCDKIARVLPVRGDVQDVALPGRRLARFCGLRVVAEFNSSTQDSVAYEDTCDQYFEGVNTANTYSPRSLSAFTFKSLETRVHETAV